MNPMIQIIGHQNSRTISSENAMLLGGFGCLSCITVAVWAAGYAVDITWRNSSPMIISDACCQFTLNGQQTSLIYFFFMIQVIK